MVLERFVGPVFNNISSFRNEYHGLRGMIKVGFLIEGHLEIGWYGCEVSEAKREDLVEEYGLENEIELLDMFDDVFNGVKVDNSFELTKSAITIKYYFPDEEEPENLGEDRVVDLAEVRVMTKVPKRKKCERGNVYLCGGYYRYDYKEIKHYDTGFMPPFKSGDVTVYLEDLTDFGYDGLIMTDMTYIRKDAVFSEVDVVPGSKIETRSLSD